jgi:hypothetical protein
MPFILAHTTGAFSVKNGIMGLGGMTVVAVVVVMAGVAALFARPNSN